MFSDPQAVLRLRPLAKQAARASELLEKCRIGQLSAEEEAEWEKFETLEHLVRMAKAQAAKEIRNAGGSVER
jgi:hypothetical protein